MSSLARLGKHLHGERDAVICQLDSPESPFGVKAPAGNPTRHKQHRGNRADHGGPDLVPPPPDLLSGSLEKRTAPGLRRLVFDSGPGRVRNGGEFPSRLGSGTAIRSPRAGGTGFVDRVAGLGHDRSRKNALAAGHLDNARQTHMILGPQPTLDFIVRETRINDRIRSIYACAADSADT